MAKDYAKKKKGGKRGASRKQNEGAVPTVVWLFTIVFVGGLVAGLGYLKFGNPSATTPVANKQVSNKPSQSKQAAKASPKNSSNNVDSDGSDVPIYNIHKTLVNREVEIPEEDLKPSENANKFVYLMPCGSFRESFRAEELKATIGMTGNTSLINAVQYKGETWYRVELGPFPRKRKAETIRHRLQDNGIHDCRIIKRSKDSL